LLLDQGYGAGYSCLSSINDQVLGILYEGTQAQLIFQQIPIAEVLNPQGRRKGGLWGRFYVK
jgi:sialidase-1